MIALRRVALALLVLHVTSAFAGRGVPARRGILTDTALEAIIRDLGTQPFDDGKLGILENATRVCWVRTDQLAVLIPRFEWREGKLNALRLWAPLIIDRERAATLLPLFPEDRTRAAGVLGIAP